ncbi:MAG: heavy metal translocating P-type ATPase [Pseudomonadota bacterium]
MLIETLALGSILYAGFKSFKKQSNAEKTGKNISTNQIKSVQEEQFAQIVEESDDQKYSAKLTFEETNKREIISASLALTLSSIGTWLYRPLGLFSIPLVIYANKSYHKKSYELIKQGKTSTEMLVSIIMTGCIILGRFFMASLIVLFFGVAARLAMQVTQNSRQSLINTFEQHPDLVWIMVENAEISIPFNELQQGDIVVVHTGEMIPADGTIVEGMASVDQHILTGEAKPVEKESGDEVFASTVVLSGKIYVKAEKTGENSTVAKITHILNNTVDFKSSLQLRADVLSKQLVNPALIAGGVALPILGFNGALAVVNAHPKNKMMGIAPIGIMNYLNLASKQGILIKDGRSLELLNKVDTIVFDKTGTLTEEQPHIGTIHCHSDYTEDDILIYAAAAEHKQKHPLAKAILQEAENRQLSIPSIEDSEYKLGYGITVNVAGKTVHLGSERFMEVEKILIPPAFREQQKLSHEEGYSLVMVAIDKHLAGAIELLPTVRPEAKAVINRLKQRQNIKATYIISGDHDIPTQKLAKTLGIDHYFAETLPEDKAAIIEQLQQEGHFICYIGDGINDSIAMKKSQVSVSLGGASTIAIDTAQIILMDGGLNHLDLLFELANNFNANMNTTFAIILVPAVISVSGAFLFGFGLTQTVILNMTGLILAIANAMTPLLKQNSLTKHFQPEKDKKSEND